MIAQVADEALLDGFLTFLEDEGEVGLSTIDAYGSDLIQLLRVCRKVDKGFTEVDESFLRAFLGVKADEGVKTTTIARKLSSMKRFFRWLKEEGFSEDDPAKKIPPIKPKRETKCPSAKDIELLLNAPDQRDPLGVRDTIMLELIYETGVKASELTRLKVSDIALSTSTLSVKGRREVRVIPLRNYMNSRLWNYLHDERRAILGERRSAYLFPSRSREKITRQALSEIFSRYSKRAELEEKITPTSLRFAHGVRMLVVEKIKIKELQKRLDHSQLKTTERYLGGTAASLSASQIFIPGSTPEPVMRPILESNNIVH